MSTLTIYPQDGSAAEQTVTDYNTITKILGDVGIQFERWETDKPLAKDAGEEEVLAAYAAAIDKLNKRFGFQTVDVVALGPEHPQKMEMRQKFLAEHTHSDYEVRFFVEGQGLFYLHIEDKVYLLMCKKGDLISVPANITHWFDMGKNPDFKCIRFFTLQEGWVGHFTDSDIALRFPDYDTHAATLE